MEGADRRSIGGTLARAAARHGGSEYDVLLVADIDGSGARIRVHAEVDGIFTRWRTPLD